MNSKACVYLFVIILIGLHSNKAHAQSQQDISSHLIGTWVIYKESHPDGGGTPKPYEYLEFKTDGTYTRTYITRKSKSMVLGRYKTSNDTISFYDNVATDGTMKARYFSDIEKLESFKADELILLSDWKRIVSRGVKKFGHKRRFRPLTAPEKKEWEALTTKIVTDFVKLKEYRGDIERGY